MWNVIVSKHTLILIDGVIILILDNVDTINKCILTYIHTTGTHWHKKKEGKYIMCKIALNIGKWVKIKEY